MTLRDK